MQSTIQTAIIESLSKPETFFEKIISLREETKKYAIYFKKIKPSAAKDHSDKSETVQLILADAEKAAESHYQSLKNFFNQVNLDDNASISAYLDSAFFNTFDEYESIVLSIFTLDLDCRINPDKLKEATQEEFEGIIQSGYETRTTEDKVLEFGNSFIAAEKQVRAARAAIKTD
jgi:hypothetical protein